MMLSDYIHQHDLSQAEFGKLAGVSHATVSRWLSGQFGPSFRVLRRIEGATGGKITAASFGAHPPSTSPDGTAGVNMAVSGPAEGRGNAA